jgi:hypothetical protein
MKIKKQLAKGVSLNEVMLSMITQSWDFDNINQVRVVSPLKQNITVLCNEADIADDMASFINPDNQPSDSGQIVRDIPFESTVYIFTVVGIFHNTEGIGNTLSAMSLHELLFMENFTERGAGDDDFGTLNKMVWSMETPEWEVYELIDKDQVKEPETPTDMHPFG